jgi:hypothetical protein
MSTDTHPSLTAAERNPSMCRGPVRWRACGTATSPRIASIYVDLPEDGDTIWIAHVVFERTPYGPEIREVMCTTRHQRIQGNLWMKFKLAFGSDERLLGRILLERWGAEIRRAVEEAA